MKPFEAVDHNNAPMTKNRFEKSLNARREAAATSKIKMSFNIYIQSK